MGLKLNGATSGSIEIDVPAVAGTDTAITIPATTGGEFIVSDSSGNIDLGPLDINGGASDDSVNIDGSGRLLVGTTTSTNVASTVGALVQTRFSGSFTNFAATRESGPAVIAIGRANGSGAQIVSSGDEIGAIRWAGADDNDLETQAATISAFVDGTPGANDMPGRLVFSTTADSASSPTERMRITSDGYIKQSNTGSYQNAAAAYNEVRSNQNDNVITRFNHFGGSVNQYGISIVTNDDQNNSSNYFVTCVGGSTTRLQLRSNGGLANYQANNTNLCDEREKKNIEALDSTWGCLKNWELKKFHYNEDADTDDKKYGVIAQQVAEYCPEVIADFVKQEATEAVVDDDGNIVTPAVEELIRMGVKEQQMMWMAIKTLQEAQTRIETLETANASLEARLTALEGGAS